MALFASIVAVAFAPTVLGMRELTQREKDWDPVIREQEYRLFLAFGDTLKCNFEVVGYPMMLDNLFQKLEAIHKNNIDINEFAEGIDRVVGTWSEERLQNSHENAMDLHKKLVQLMCREDCNGPSKQKAISYTAEAIAELQQKQIDHVKKRDEEVLVIEKLIVEHYENAKQVRRYDLKNIMAYSGEFTAKIIKEVTKDRKYKPRCCHDKDGSFNKYKAAWRRGFLGPNGGGDNLMLTGKRLTEVSRRRLMDEERIRKHKLLRSLN